MKLRKLIIHNLASIEDATIDFTASPLSDSEVFLITGDTGSGKTTILDAICLALYAKTPRLKNGNTASGSTEDGLKDRDTMQLVRKNATDCFVRLSFSGSDSQEYEAEWSVVRKRKNMSRTWRLANLSNPQSSPEEGNGGGGQKDKPIEEAISKAIGLDFEQFCRTTMLAQGEFTRFLSSSDKEKAEILEKVTGTDIYSKIGAKVYEITSLHEKEWNVAKEKTEGVETLTEQQISEKTQQLQTISEQQVCQTRQLESENVKKVWIEQFNALSKQLAEAQEALTAAKQKAQSEDSRNQTLTLGQWELTTEVRARLSENMHARQDISVQDDILRQAQNTYHTLQNGQAFLSKQISVMSVRLGQLQQQIAAEADNAGVYDNVQTLTAHLYSVARDRQEIAKQQTNAAEQEKTVTTTLTPAYERLKMECKKQSEEVQSARAAVAKAEGEVNNLNLPESRIRRDRVSVSLNNLRLSQERLDNYLDALKKHAERQQQLLQLKEQLRLTDIEIEELGPRVHDAQILCDERKKALDMQKETLNDFAISMRQRLQPGDTCPICGQTVACEIQHDQVWQQLVEKAQQAYDQQQRLYNQLNSRLQQLLANQKVMQENYSGQERSLSADTSVSESEARLVSQCRLSTLADALLDIPLETDRLKQAIEQQYRVEHESLNSLNQAIALGEEKEKELRRLRTALDIKVGQLDNLNSKVASAQSRLAEAKAALQAAQSIIKTKQSDLQSALDTIRPYLANTVWQTDDLSRTDALAATLNNAAKQYATNVSEAQLCTNDLALLSGEKQRVDATFDDIAKLMPQWQAASIADSGSATEIPALLTRLTQLHADISSAKTIRQNALNQIDKNDKLIREFLDQHTDITQERLEELHRLSATDIQTLRATISQLQTTLEQKRTICDNLLGQLSEHNSRKPAFAEGETYETILNAIDSITQTIRTLSEQKGAIDQQLQADKQTRQRLDEYIKEAERRRQNYNRWSRLNNLIGDKDGTKFRRIAQGYILSNLVQAANVYLMRLTNRYTLQCLPGTFIILVEDSYQGFARRPASTISGGESFLVSLALALALSDIGQSLRVETLFIDEGFGTLSGEPLQKAIETLQSLRKHAGRQVGIISHIEEVRERIPVQIQVSRQNNASGSRITITP